MAPPGALVLARFLMLTAHLVALGMAAWARDPHVRASLPLEFSAEEYARVDAELLGALGGVLGMLALEFGGLFAGVSRFHRWQCLLSVVAHAPAAITLGLALLEGWDVGCFWPLLVLCSVPPAVTELLLLLAAALGRRGKL